MSIAKYQSIAISIAKSQKHYNKYYKISKVLQYLLQNLKCTAISLAEYMITVHLTTIITMILIYWYIETKKDDNYNKNHHQ